MDLKLIFASITLLLSVSLLITDVQGSPTPQEPVPVPPPKRQTLKERCGNDDMDCQERNRKRQDDNEKGRLRELTEFINVHGKKYRVTIKWPEVAKEHEELSKKHG